MQDMDAIYRKHSKMIYNYLLSKTGNPEQAEELTQETYFRAIQSISRYDGSCQITTWLCQIANHIWLQYLDKRKTQPLEDNIPSAEASPEDQAITSGERVNLYRLIRQLDEPIREVMYLRLSSELSFKEIGEVVGKNETWARVAFYRGKQKIMKGGSL